MKKIEKYLYVMIPIIFGMVLILIGIYVTKSRPEVLHGILLICTGLLCICCFCLTSLLAKIVEKNIQ